MSKLRERLLVVVDQMINQSNESVPLGPIRTDQAMVKIGYLLAAGLFSIAAALENSHDQP